MSGRGARNASREDEIGTVTGSTFDALVRKGEGPIVVEFMSYGCAYCRALEPILQQVAETMKAKEKIFRVNVGVEQELAERYEVGGTPTLIMFLNGEEIGRVEGVDPTVSRVLAVVKQPFESLREG